MIKNPNAIGSDKPDSSKQDESIHSKLLKKQILIIVLLMLMLGVIAVSIYFVQFGFEGPNVKLTWDSGTDLMDQGVIPHNQSILEVNLSFDRNSTPQIQLVNLKKKNGYVRNDLIEQEEYQLILSNALGTVYKRSFSVPDRVWSPPPEDPSIEDVESSIELDSVNFTLTVPWYEAVTELSVLDGNGNNIFTEPAVNVTEEQNIPQFKSVTGQEFKDAHKKSVFSFSSLVNFLTPQTYAQSQETVDVVFVSDNYSLDDQDLFHTDVERMIEHFLTYEPMKTRASQFTFHIVDNVSPLGCQHHGRLIICDNTKVMEVVNSASVPYDVITVVLNSSKYGGSGGQISTTYNGEPWSEEVFVHEFGHTFARLVDEYVASNPYTDLDKNCYNGNPPNQLWSNILANVSYYSECNYPGWYRSSPNSIMRSIDATYFNLVSQYWISFYMNRYAGDLAINQPTPEPSVDPTITTTTPTPTPKENQPLTPAPTPTSILIQGQTESPTPTPIPTSISEQTATPAPTSPTIPTATPIITPPTSDPTIGTQPTASPTPTLLPTATPVPTPAPTPTIPPLNCFHGIEISLASYSDTGNPGDTIGNTLILTNLNPSGCGPTALLGISRAHPTQPMTMTFSSQSVSIPANQTVQVPFSLNLLPGANPGYYLYQIWVAGFGPLNGYVTVN